MLWSLAQGPFFIMFKVKVVVFGSINIDYFLKVDRQPNIGETMSAHSIKMGYGGKGANQAVACARLGAETTLLA